MQALVGFTPAEFNALVDELRPYIKEPRDIFYSGQHWRIKSCRVDIETRVFMVLRHLRTGGTFLSLSEDCGLSVPTLSRDFTHIVDIMFAHLYPQEVSWPNAVERASMHGKLPGFANGIMIIDGAWKRLNKPKVLQRLYYSGKWKAVRHHMGKGRWGCAGWGGGWGARRGLTGQDWDGQGWAGLCGKVLCGVRLQVKKNAGRGEVGWGSAAMGRAGWGGVGMRTARHRGPRRGWGGEGGWCGQGFHFLFV